MLRVCRRRLARHRFIVVFIVLSALCLLSVIHETDPTLIDELTHRSGNRSRLFCILMHSHSNHERFVQLSNLTWGKHCDRIGVARFRRIQATDDSFDVPQMSFYVNLWTRVLATVRDSIGAHEYISNNDLLLIVPAQTFVFHEKLPTLLNASADSLRVPLIIVHEQHEGNAYLLNGRALDLIRNTELMETCVKHLHPTARERHLWACVKNALSRQHPQTNCDDGDCFIRYHENHITLSHIKNGYCFGEYLPTCRPIALLYPTSLGDFVTLEFFRYRLKARSADDVL